MIQVEVPKGLRSEDTLFSQEKRELVILPQLDMFLGVRGSVLEKHEPRSERNHLFLKETFVEMIAERNKRAEDLDSSEVHEAIGIVNRLLPYFTYGVLCMDGRVNRTLMFGIPIGSKGGFIRLPAGDPQEFAPAEKGGVMLRPNSYFANVLDKAAPEDVEIVEVLDSHVGCAARNRIEEPKSQDRGDKGLLQDVKRKKKIATALLGRSEKTIPVQTSFDPTHGYLYMGLEKDAVLAQAEKADGFTPKLLEDLADQDEILYTGNIVHDPQIQKLFEEHQIDQFDWESNYRNTTVSFWRNIDRMVTNNHLAEYLQKTYIKEIFPGMNEKELQERSILVLANAYNAYHLNKDGQYPHAEHKESCIVISEEESGPLGKSPSFALFSDATDMYDENLRLAEGLIRSNRKEGRVKDHTGQYSNEDTESDFARAPVPVLHQTIIREEGTDWDHVRAIVSDEGAIPKDWYKINSKQFQDHLRKIDPFMPLSTYNALDALRREMSAIYDPEGNTDEALFDGSLEIVPVLVDSKRRVQAIVPFIHFGHVQNGDK